MVQSNFVRMTSVFVIELLGMKSLRVTMFMIRMPLGILGYEMSIFDTRSDPGTNRAVHGSATSSDEPRYPERTLRYARP